MTTAELVVVGAAVFLAGMVQIVSGFGFGLLSVPLMTLAIPTRDAVVVSTLLGAGVSLSQAWYQRAHRQRVLVRRLTIAAYVGMPLGLWVFVVVDDHVLRLMLGIAVLISVGLLAARVNLRHSGPALDAGAGFVSGVLNTSLSTNGPPLVFVLQARHLEPDEFRGTISMVFALSNIAGIGLFIAAGKIHVNGLVAAAVALPALGAGQLAGYPLRRHVHGERFRWMVLALLVVAAASAMISAFT